MYLAVVVLMLGSAWHTVRALKAGTFRPGRWNLAAMVAAFFVMSGALWMRGQAVGACPLGTVPDLLAFVGWAVLLIYLLVGPVSRLSLFGAFSAPLVLVLALMAALWPGGAEVVRPGPPNALVELHAALSVMAYGAFGLAAVAGWMFVLMDRLLKTHRLPPVFFHLPPVQNLAAANERLVLVGVGLLTLAYGAGVAAGLPVDGAKAVVSVGIWGVYAGLAVWRLSRRLGARAFALGCAGLFCLLVVMLPWLQAVSVPRP